MNDQLCIQIFHECTGEHSHAYPQILVPMQEAMRIRAGEAEFEVKLKELFFVPAGTQHRCNYRGKLLVINLPAEVLDNREVAALACPTVVAMQGQITQLVDLIQAELRQDPGSKSVRYLYNYLYSKLCENCAAPSIRYIGEHYDLPITVNQLAEMERYNVTYYSDWFKQQTGCSPSLYLRHIRVSRAKELLIDSNFSVMEIAVMVGYSSNSTFTRAFHSITGMTPKAYRECPCFAKKLG